MDMAAFLTIPYKHTGIKTGGWDRNRLLCPIKNSYYKEKEGKENGSEISWKET